MSVSMSGSYKYTLRHFMVASRLQYEYTATVWTPHLSKDIDKLEAVQTFILKMCSKDWKANYPDLLDHHQLPLSMHEGSI